MQNRTIKTLLAHWNEARGKATAARRQDINPARLGGALPSIFMLEAGPAGLQFRLAGTLICALYGRELRGSPFSTLWHPRSAEAVRSAAHQALSQPCPILISASARIEDTGSMPAKVILLPVSSADDKVDRLIGAIELPRQQDFLSGQNDFSLDVDAFGQPSGWPFFGACRQKPDFATPPEAANPATDSRIAH